MNIRLITRTASCLCMIAFAAYLLVDPRHTLGEERPTRPIKLMVNGNQVDFTMVSCPKGTMIDGRPVALPGEEASFKLKTQERDSELWILETKVSYDQFAKVCGKGKADEVINTDLANPGSKEPLPLVQKDQRSADLPMVGLTIEEALAFCEALKKADPECQSDRLEVASTTYRLPTHMEWQYACRATTTIDEAKERPDLPVWVNPPVATIWNDLTEWATGQKGIKVDPETASKKTQREVLQLFLSVAWDKEQLAAKKKSGKGAEDHSGELPEAFRKILFPGLYGSVNAPTRLYGVKTDSPEKAKDMKEDCKKNAWGLYHMHDLAPELTLATLDDPLAKDKYYIDGAGYNVPYSGPRETRNRWFIWGGSSIDSKSREKDKSEAAELAKTRKRDIDTELLISQRKKICSFRFVQDRSLSKKWFEAIRWAAMQPGDYSAIKKDLEEKRRTVQQLAHGESLADKVVPIVAVYKMVASYGHGGRLGDNAEGGKADTKTDDSSDSTADQIAKLSDEKDPYFRYLADVMKAEKSNPVAKTR